MCFCSTEPGTQASLLSLFQPKPMIHRSQGEQEKPTWLLCWLLCRLQGNAERALFTLHDAAANKLPQGPEIVQETPSAGRTPFPPLTNSLTEHFALLGSAFRAEVSKDLPVSLAPGHSAEQAPAPTEQRVDSQGPCDPHWVAGRVS